MKNTLVMAAVLFSLAIAPAPSQGQKLGANSCTDILGATVDYTPEGLHEPPAPNEVTPLVRVTLQGAKCNDGSPAVMYVRPSTAFFGVGSEANPLPGNDPSSKWLIHFQGGSSCSGGVDCLKRWCGQGQSFESAGKMSSLGTPLAMIPGKENDPWGIFSRDGADSNEFASYNQVFLYYCSSDQWAGSAAIEGLNANDGISIDEEYSIRFDGQKIVQKAFNAMVNAVSPDSNSYYDTALPPLSEATRVVLTGSSAGAMGLRHHVDRIKTKLEALSPGVEVFAVFDAGFGPAFDSPNVEFPLEGAAIAAPFSFFSIPENAAQLHNSISVPRAFSFWGANAKALDESCLASTTNPLGSHPGVCLDGTYLQQNHISTSSFVRSDLIDPLVVDAFDALGIVVTGTGQTPLEDHADQVADQMNTLASPQIGVFGPSCSRHVALTSRKHFFGDSLDPGGLLGPKSFHGSLAEWMAGNGVGYVEELLPGAPIGFYCP